MCTVQYSYLPIYILLISEMCRTSVEKKKFVYCFFIFLVFSANLIQFAVDAEACITDNPECRNDSGEVDEDCNVHFAQSCVNVGELMKRHRFEPLKIKGIVTTEYCIIKGLSRMEPAEGKDVMTERNSTYASSIFYAQFPLLDIECLHQFDENPANIPPFLLKSEQQIPHTNCPQNTSFHIMALKDMLKLEACQPKPARGGSDKNKNAKKKGFVYIKWVNAHVRFRSVVKAESNKVQITELEILEKNYDKIDVKCKGDTSEFNRSCKCFIATKFLVNYVIYSVHLVLPCAIGKTSRTEQEIARYFTCPEF